MYVLRKESVNSVLRIRVHSVTVGCRLPMHMLLQQLCLLRLMPAGGMLLLLVVWEMQPFSEQAMRGKWAGLHFIQNMFFHFHTIQNEIAVNVVFRIELKGSIEFLLQKVDLCAE